MRETRAVDDPVFPLATRPVHLGSGARVVRLEEFDGSPDWYERYGASVAGDGIEGRLVSMHTFDAPWDSWEMHPVGEELVACVAGSVVLHQEIDGEDTTVELHAGEAVINPAGVWHTADVDGACTALFITAGQGTQVRPR
jgi:mannose-6-phosphate isomerase-like protein (cupin superfamily)